MPRRRYATRVPFAPPVAEAPGQREIAAVRDIVHALLRSDRPDDVFQFALDRVSPVVGASFASVYVVDGASELMRLVAAHNWPERHRPWLGETRVRVGFGPSGEAASERRAIEIPDVFSDPDLEDWHDVARELGFRAIVAFPLQTTTRVHGTVAFYFVNPGALAAEKRGLLRIVADQMAATAEKAALLDELRRANAAIVEANAELERQYVAVVEAQRVKDQFLANVSSEIRAPLVNVTANLALITGRDSQPLSDEQRAAVALAHASGTQLLEMLDALLELGALERGTLDVSVEEFDPRVPLREAMGSATGLPDGVHLIAEEPVHALPCARGDRKRVTRILVTLLSNAFKFTASGEVRASVTVADGLLEYRVRDTGAGLAPEAQLLVFDAFRQVDDTHARGLGVPGLDLALSRGMARHLGGDIDLVSAPGEGSTFTLHIPLEFTKPEAGS